MNTVALNMHACSYNNSSFQEVDRLIRLHEDHVRKDETKQKKRQKRFRKERQKVMEHIEDLRSPSRDVTSKNTAKDSSESERVKASTKVSCAN